MLHYKPAIFLFLFFSLFSFSQTDSTNTLTFDFNEGKVKEKNNKVIPKGVGISLVKDRFGNEQSAIYLHGNPDSYLNLGTSPYLKPQTGSISIWVNLDRAIYAGRGSESNPIIGTKNGLQDDFNYSYGLCYDFKSKRFCALSHKDSTQDINIKSENEIVFNTWYHLVYTFDKSNFAFYINGKLQQTAQKEFKINYLLGDTVIVGNTANKKNNRWSQGIFDDIRVFHYSLSQKEIIDLYNAPNPNKTKQFFVDVAKYLGIILFFIIIIIIILYRNKQKLKKQKEQFELTNRINELEIKVIKNQMNPHFVSNCLAAIQELIYTENYKKAAQYIAKFSFFLRQVLNYSDKTYITLSEELNLINLNIELEQLRFKEEFDFKINTSDAVDTDEILIPSLITQPFIENAIWHGLLPLKNKRKPSLTITIFEKNNSIFIEIEDNGVGRKEQDLYKNDSKGTKLVKDKLESINRLLRENDYKLEITDLFNKFNEPSGTKITIQLKNSKE